MPFDRFGQPFFYPSKSGGWFYEMSDNPKNDDGVDWPSEMSFSGAVATMHPNGPTDFGIGKNISSFNDSIGGCGMDFTATAKRGYAFKADDARDIEFKCVMKVSGTGSNGFSISFCTGHHTGNNCCQGFAYMLTTEINDNPSSFTFRKETVHVEYSNSPEGNWTNPACNVKINGLGRFVGLGACRYNKPSSGGTSPQDDTVILEAWFNPDPDDDPTDWTMLRRIEDKPGKGWTGSKGKCNGDSDQIGVWSGAQNRMKTNATGGSIQFKSVTLREIDPLGTFEEPEPPGGGGGGTTVVRKIHLAIIRGQDPQDYKGITRTFTEELVEMQTSPNRGGDLGKESWKDYVASPPGHGEGEIGDICDNHVPRESQYASGLWVQPYWSNNDANCVAPGIDEIDLGGSSKVTNQGGGVVMKTPTIYMIYWGTNWRDRSSAPTAAGLTDLIQNKLLVTDAQYFSKLSQYGQCGVPVWGGAVFNVTTPIPSSTTIEVQVALQAILDSFNNGLLTIPEDSEDKIYFLITPIGKSLVSNGVGGFAGLKEARFFSLNIIPNPDPATVTYTYESKFGTQGSGNGQFEDPHDIDFDSAGNCFVCDRVRNDVQKFTPSGTYISKFGSGGSGDGQFAVPYSIGTDASDNIYVADRDNNRVQKFNSAGVYQSKITTAGGTSLAGPEDLAFDPVNGDIYITDTDNNRIVKFSSAHTFILQWGSTGSGDGQFEHPHSINVDSDRNVFVSCGDQPYIQKFSSTGTFIKKFGSEGTGQGQTQMFLEHTDIDLADRVHLINNDSRPIINVWDNEGVWLTQYGKTTKGSANGQFSEPEHITCDSTGKPYVVDSGNHRIQIFSVDASTPPPPGPGPGPGPGPPAEPSKVKGTFILKRDINVYRTDACEGTGGGGGSGGSAIFFGPIATNFDKELSDTSSHSYRTRLAVYLKRSGSSMKGKVLKQFDVPLKKEGSPAATPTITAAIWNSTGSIIYTSPTAIDPTTLTTSFVSKSFDFSANIHEFVVGDRVGIRYYADSSTSDVNYIVAGYDMIGEGNTTMLQLESGVWKEKLDRDLACTMWQ